MLLPKSAKNDAAGVSCTMHAFQDTDMIRWKAVVSKDAAADGAFVYCVRTTKIFCRPVCKARLPRRANVVFYETATQARRAGFRACKRCQPMLESHMPSGEAERKVQEFLNRTDFFAETQSIPTLDSMAKHAGLSKWHFHRVFKKTVGVTPMEYRRICQELASSDGNLNKIQPYPLRSPRAVMHLISPSSSSSAVTPSYSTDALSTREFTSEWGQAETLTLSMTAEQRPSACQSSSRSPPCESGVAAYDHEPGAYHFSYEDHFAYDDWLLDIQPGQPES